MRYESGYYVVEARSGNPVKVDNFSGIVNYIRREDLRTKDGEIPTLNYLVTELVHCPLRLTGEIGEVEILTKSQAFERGLVNLQQEA